MKILIVSDTHGNTILLDSVIFRHHASVDLVVHLGDNMLDINDVMRNYPQIPYISVLGNCDYASMYVNPKYEGCFTAELRRIFYTHGHRHGVEYSVERLVSYAKIKSCNIALYGHTHVGLCMETGSVLVINPGSLSRPRDNTNGTYALLTIIGENAECKLMEV